MTLTIDQKREKFQRKLVGLGVKQSVVNNLRSLHNITTFSELKSHQEDLQLSILPGIEQRYQQKLKFILSHLDRVQLDYDELMNLTHFYRQPLSKTALDLPIENATHPSIYEELGGHPPNANTVIERRNDALDRTYYVSAETPLSMCGYCGVREGELDCNKLANCPCVKAVTSVQKVNGSCINLRVLSDVAADE